MKILCVGKINIKGTTIDYECNGKIKSEFSPK